MKFRHRHKNSHHSSDGHTDIDKFGFGDLGWDPRKEDPEFLPELIVFDLDFTLWSCWIDFHTNGPPYTKSGGTVSDKYGDTIRLFPDVPKVIALIMQLPNTKIALASRTERPEWARLALPLFDIDIGDGTKKTLAECVRYSQIYPGSKIKHFRALAKISDIDYSRMMFFDDEPRNSEVGRELGVTFVHVDDKFGVNWSQFIQYLWSYIQQRKEGVQ